MAITSKNCIVSHVLSFDSGELVGGYVEDCDLFIDCYGHVLGSSDVNRTEILPKHLASMACILDLVYGGYDSPVAAQAPDVADVAVVAPVVTPLPVVALPDPVVALPTPEPVKVDLPAPVAIAPEIWGATTATEIAKDVIAVAPIVAATPIVAVAPEAPITLEPIVAPLPTPVVPLDTIVLPTATEASPVELVPVKALPDVVSTPEATFVVPAQSVPADVKPETQPTVEPTSEPVAVVAASEPNGVIEVATVDPQVPVVAPDGLNQAQAVPSSNVADVAQAPATIETKSTANLNDSDNEAALKAFL